jgi:pyruvate dehydrogenase E1 component beta subunit
MKRMKYREALRDGIREEMERDPSVFCIGEGIGKRGGSYKVTEGLFGQFGPTRVIDTPISEASFVGMAVGAALVGMHPIAEILFVDFALLAMDQIINQGAKYQFMSGGQGTVPLVLRTQGGSGNGLAGQHSQSLEALFYHIPGLTLVMPSTPYDAKGLLKSAVRHGSPVVFLEHKLLYMTEGDLPEDEYLIPIGEAEVKREGRDVTIVTYSYMTLECMRAAELLAQDGVEVEIVDLRTLVPLDKRRIVESVKKTGKLVVVSEACKRGCVGSDIIAEIVEVAFDYLDAPPRRVAGKNTTIPFNLELEKMCVPSVEEIADTVRALVER